MGPICYSGMVHPCHTQIAGPVHIFYDADDSHCFACLWYNGLDITHPHIIMVSAHNMLSHQHGVYSDCAFPTSVVIDANGKVKYNFFKNEFDAPT
jgi:hypothetical protein